MHLYDVYDLKYKTIRSWARAYGEEIKAGAGYATQPPVICVTFANDSFEDGETTKIHKCCKIMDIDDKTVFSNALELHYIDMKAFVKTINESDSITKGETVETMLTSWLAFITEKDIEDKEIIRSICEEQEEIGMAVSTLVRLSEDKVTRQAYQRRQDEIMLYNKQISDFKQALEQASFEVQQANFKAEQTDLRAEQATRETAKATRETAQAKRDLAEKDAIIAQLMERLGEK